MTKSNDATIDEPEIDPSDQSNGDAARAAQLATLKDAMPLNRVNLVGLFGPQNDLRALIRTPNGRIQEVAPGDKAGFGRIVGIDADGVMLEKFGRTSRLAMPAK